MTIASSHVLRMFSNDAGICSATLVLSNGQEFFCLAFVTGRRNVTSWVSCVACKLSFVNSALPKGSDASEL